MLDPDEIEAIVRNCIEKNQKIEISNISKDTKAENYLPHYRNYPDASRYNIISYNKKLDLHSIRIFEDPEIKDVVIKQLKKIFDIKDPWDDDPDYFIRKFELVDAEFNEEVESNLTDSEGNYYLLKINPICVDVRNNEFIPDYIVFPDACRYSIYTHDVSNQQEMTIYFENIMLKDDVVKQLKKIYKMVDPWDNEPDYFDSKSDLHLKQYWEIKEKRENGKLPKIVILGKAQIGKRKIEIYLASERKNEMREYWPTWNDDMDRKVITWTEDADNDKHENIFQDRLVILERMHGQDEGAWRLVYQKWNRKYILNNDGKKQWIDADHNGIEKFEEYYFEDDVKIKFSKNK